MTGSNAAGAMKLSPLAKKLGMKPGMRALIVASTAGYLECLEPLPEGTNVASVASGRHEFVQLFVKCLRELSDSLPELLLHTTGGARVWVAYPKKTSGIASDLGRDAVCAEVITMGWLPVSIVSIDEVWSALRFKPKEEVKSQRVRPNS